MRAEIDTNLFYIKFLEKDVRVPCAPNNQQTDFIEKTIIRVADKREKRIRKWMEKQKKDAKEKSNANNKIVPVIPSPAAGSMLNPAT